MPLPAADQAAIRALSRSTIEGTTVGLKRFLKRSLWIGSTNHYAIDVVAKLKTAEPVSAVQQRNLAQYISASVVLHANDGWSYLGRAIACLLSGDSHRGLHLAYYAELRAAMSLLASEGIGIFNNKHYIVPAANTARKLHAREGTHMLAWTALEYWSQQPSSGALFANVVRPEGRPLNEWFGSLGGAGTLVPQARDWFNQWGMDLSLAVNDREARNQSSYRPDGIPAVWQVSASQALDFVREMWSLLEPNSTSSFDLLDRYILRLALERHYHGTRGRQAAPTDHDYQRFIAQIMIAQNTEQAAHNRIGSFLLRSTLPTDPSIFFYSTKIPSNTGADPLSVLSRAVLLLRIATGSARDILARGGIDAETLTFWWTKIGESRGLWSPGNPPEMLSDLWADVKESLDEAVDIEAAEPDAFASMKKIAFDVAGRFNVLSSHERVSLWGLCPT